MGKKKKRKKRGILSFPPRAISPVLRNDTGVITSRIALLWVNGVVRCSRTGRPALVVVGITFLPFALWEGGRGGVVRWFRRDAGGRGGRAARDEMMRAFGGHHRRDGGCLTHSSGRRGRRRRFQRTLGWPHRTGYSSRGDCFASY